MYILSFKVQCNLYRCFKVLLYLSCISLFWCFLFFLRLIVFFTRENLATLYTISTGARILTYRATYTEGVVRSNEKG